MINVKDQVYSALATVCSNVSDVYPQDWETMPAIQYTEESNTVYTKTDGAEQLSYLRYRIDVWNTGSTTQLSLDVDAALSALGLTRVECQDVSDPSFRRHKSMRYEGIIDNTNETVYWNNNR